MVRSGEFSVEEVLLDELTVVQELASWQEPLTSVGLWSPEDLAGQQTETTMKDDLWQALESANASAPQMRTAARFGDPGPTDGAVPEPADQRRSALLHCRRLH